MDTTLFFNKDPIFDDNGEDELEQKSVHIRVVQRKSRKYITTIEGLNKDLDLSKLARFMRKTFHCQADVFDVKENNIISKIIKLQGDQRDNIKKFFIAEQIIPSNLIKVHGF